MPASRWLEYILFPPKSLNRRKLVTRLQKKTILITGASSGIGEQLSFMLGEYPVHLILVARREDKLQEIKQRIEAAGPAKVTIYALDLRDDERMQELLADLHTKHDGIDIIVSNAGHSIRRSIYDSLDRYHDFTRTMSINYFAPVQLILSLMPVLERSGGHIIHTSTVNALLYPVPGWAAYQASKSAFDVWFRSVEPELNRRGVHTTSLYLPLVRTPMIQPTEAYRKMPAMTPEQVARIIGRSIYTRRRSWQPWWLFIGRIGSVMFRGLWARMALRMIGAEDSRSRGTDRRCEVD
jgi:short-subunit dehydrogenase